MWNYDKFFTENNIIGIKNLYENKVFNNVIDTTLGTSWLNNYKNAELSFKGQYVAEDDETLHGYTTDFQIEYIIQLNENGDVVEKLFDRERDIPKPMPELKTGMFIRVAKFYKTELGFVDMKNNRVIYQSGGYDYIKNEDAPGIYDKIIEVYSEDTRAFNYCSEKDLIWRKTN